MNRNPLLNFLWAAAAFVLAAALLPGCNRTTPKQAPPPPAVTVSRPSEREVVRWDEYSGYLSSPKTVIVSARVSGLLEEAPFQEGAIVQQGDLLFEIDPRPFQADFDNKQAAVEQARATAHKARADLDRSLRLLRAQVIAQASYDTDKAASEEADASLSAAEAALETSRLNLDWTDVRAPITGRVSRINVTVGNLVNGGSGQATALTTIVSIDPLYCYIDVPQVTALHYQELALQEKQGNVAGAKLPCFLQLENETNFPRQGVIDFVDNQVDVNTGTVQIRCVISNPTSVLTPGLFALTSIPATSRYRTLLIPDAAVNTDQNERYLLIVGNDDVVRQRTVRLGAVFGTLRSITEGLNPGEWVIVNGLQLAAPGSKVNPHATSISATALNALENIAARPPDVEASVMQAATQSTQVSAEAHQ